VSGIRHVAPSPTTALDDGGLIMLGLYEWLHETIAEENSAHAETEGN
jgi:hypothetical protein